MCAAQHVPAESFRLGRRQRLKSDREIRQAYRQGRRWVGKYMVLWLRSGENAAGRLAVVSSRKVGNAVARNRARRKLREAFRLNRQGLEIKHDFVLVARRRIGKARADEVEAELLRLTKQAGVVKESER